MPEYLSPGVYVEEIDNGAKPIQGVGTATAVFIGFTEKAQARVRIDDDWVITDITNRPRLVTSWSQFNEFFGGFVPGAYLPMAVYGYFQNGGTRCYILSVRTLPKAQAALLNAEGKPMLVVQAKQAGFDGARLRVRVETPETAQEEGPLFNLYVEREKVSGGWKAEESFKNVRLVESDLTGQVKLKVVFQDMALPRLVELVVPAGAQTAAQLQPREQQQPLQLNKQSLTAPSSDTFEGNTNDRTGINGLEALDDVTIIAVPDLMTTAPGEKLDLKMVKAVQTQLIAHCEKMADRVVILDTPPGLSPQDVREWRKEICAYDSSYAAMYYPWIEVQDPATRRSSLVPPSGHLAGIWARNDATRGVHKAPANEVVRGCTGLAFNITKNEQDVLNPEGINCIRVFPGMGIRVWGGRTLSSNASWRYINVRRLFNYVEKSIERGTMWVVFEPNDYRLWARVVRDVTAFLKTVWSSGALFGRTPEEAFYVKCDEELNPAESRDLGRLVVEVGLAPVKPAEFVIFRISQWSGSGAEGGEGGGGEGGEGESQAKEE